MLKPRHPAAIPIERGFIRLAHGDVHYRAAGSGPLVLALHESPRSSLSMLPVIEALAGSYRVIAPDTPGYGLSDPLPEDAPSLDDFLDVIAGLLDALGVDRVALYGAHTGAALATAFALREPDRVTALVLDGLSAFTGDEVASFQRDYLAPYEPHWDGRHVMGLWSRCRDLFTWFPWHERTQARRLASDPGDVAPVQRSAIGFLQAGAHYTKAYIRAASFQPNDVIANLTVPTRVIARSGDLIADHLERLTPGPQWEIAALGEGLGEWQAALLTGFDRGDRPDAVSLRSEATEGASLVAVGEGWLHARLAGPVDGPLRLLVPGLPGDPEALIAAETLAHPDARLILLSPPGCGGSDPLTGRDADLAAVIDVLAEALSRLGLIPDSAAGEGAGAVIADLLLQRLGLSIKAERIDPPAWLSGTGTLPDAPLLTPMAAAWDGSHLTSAWFQLRDLALYDVPPGAGVVTRRAASETPDVARLDRLFRAYVQGPDCATILAQVVEHVRAEGSD
ncbi:alpha/beta fold hydrolase [Brevundimonas sp.]|uniref:alpha/beta fold hydrolase n=1 Tax=Brevundimonas sp. TaxID=1871086 RepID=UPI003D149EB5